ncbi:hypothetical protein MJO29_004257 [Puccinia striiformis f. sp. tritici]|nr:hypothetical protein MJO29_005022 [Puccinia striiformis f. sp. tritici]KAI7963830.1 hypothetical protein MJO29_004257 [Puccinia striiformis f. sp. tritici]
MTQKTELLFNNPISSQLINLSSTSFRKPFTKKTSIHQQTFMEHHCCTHKVIVGPLGLIVVGPSESPLDARNDLWMLGTTSGCLERPLDAWNDTWTLETTSGRSEQPLDARNDLWTLGTTPGRLESLLDSHNRR